MATTEYLGIDTFCNQHMGQEIAVNLMGLGEKHTISGALEQIYPDCLQIKERYRTVYVAKQSIAVIYESAHSGKVTLGPKLF